ncbi:MAG: T9SS type A sorting domain-containing protein, partial [Bacteroidia bacterium]|nr:T9SS type A sorting domain-containing protein [Bacteroidia bacterium]
QEDVGNSVHNGKIWQYTIATDALTLLAKHDVSRFGDVGISATAPFNVDEETSGIIDMEDILGAGNFLTVDQAHYATNTELVEGGQLMKLFNPDTYTSFITGLNDVSDVSINNSITLYPNPTNKEATVSLVLDKEDRIVISLYDMKGKLVLPSVDKSFGKGTQNVAFNTSDLKDGIYFMQVSSSTKTTRIKTMIIH